MKRVINIEKEFDDVVSASGGSLVRDLLGHSPPINNADYLFQNAKVVAELKCLQENKLEDPVLMENMEQLWSKWRNQRLVTGDIPDRILSDSIPQQCSRELYSLCAKPLKNVIKKANRQIRQTKTAFSLNDYHGLLILANDGNFALPPKTLLSFVAKILQHDYSEIEDFIIFSGNMLAASPNVDRPCYIWLSGCTSNGPKVAPEFIEQLRIAWKAHHESLTGKVFKEFGDSTERQLPI